MQGAETLTNNLKQIRWANGPGCVRSSASVVILTSNVIDGDWGARPGVLRIGCPHHRIVESLNAFHKIQWNQFPLNYFVTGINLFYFGASVSNVSTSLPFLFFLVSRLCFLASSGASPTIAYTYKINNFRHGPISRLLRWSLSQARPNTIHYPHGNSSTTRPIMSSTRRRTVEILAF